MAKSWEGCDHTAHSSSYTITQENKKKSKRRPSFAWPSQEMFFAFAEVSRWLGRFCWVLLLLLKTVCVQLCSNKNRTPKGIHLSNNVYLRIQWHSGSNLRVYLSCNCEKNALKTTLENTSHIISHVLEISISQLIISPTLLWSHWVSYEVARSSCYIPWPTVAVPGTDTTCAEYPAVSPPWFKGMSEFIQFPCTLKQILHLKQLLGEGLFAIGSYRPNKINGLIRKMEEFNFWKTVF